MAKVYILTEEDFELLILRLDRDPENGYDGGSSQVLSKEENIAKKDAHKFYNYQIRRWIDGVKR